MKSLSTPGSWLHRVGLRQIPVIAWLALAVSLAATAGAWLFASRQIRNQTHLRLQHELDQGVAKLRERLLLCESVVHGAQGLYAASKSIERREWQVYGQGLFGEKQYPGIRALLSVSFVPHTNLGPYLRITRSDEAPSFTIEPAGERAHYLPIKFIQSRNPGNELLGQDLGLIPELRDRLWEACDSDSFTLTSLVKLPGSTERSPEVLLILPVYRNDAPRSSVAERRLALDAWVAAVLPLRDLAEGIISSPESSLRIEEDAESSQRLYETRPPSDLSSTPARETAELSQPLTVGGRTWRVSLRSRGSFASSAEQVFPGLVLLSGCLGGVFIFYLLSSLANTRAKAFRLATDMTQTLRERERQLVEASRHAGMAEVAAGVLHNVGNALNSVNVSANLLVDHLRQSKVGSLGQAMKLLRQHGRDLGVFLTSDPKGKQLPLFLEAVSDRLAKEQRSLLEETLCLQQNIEQIKHIVAMHESYAKTSGILETLSPQDLVESALRMSSTALIREQLEIVRAFEDVPPVLADRHLTLQILVNLINNAKEALDQVEGPRRLTLRIAHGAHRRVRLEVIDNGSGIAVENLTRIFQHGFTTKRTGHGFGLHSGANAAKEMGGSLSVWSQGPGTGATFSLELPASRRNLRSAAADEATPAQAA